MLTYKMHLIRTGKTGAASRGIYAGQLDLPLCSEGRKALEKLKRDCEYPRAEIVFTSPLSRCVETAGILYPDTFTEEEDALIDMDIGAFEGKSFSELRKDPAFSRWIENSLENTPPGGEELSGFTARIIGAAGAIFARMMEERLTSVAVITHGGVIMTLLAAIGAPRLPVNEWAVENGTGYTLLFTPQMWMRDGLAEVFRNLPDSPGGYGDGLYQNED